MALSKARYRVKQQGYGFEVHDCQLEPRPMLLAQFPGLAEEAKERAQQYADFMNVGSWLTPDRTDTPVARIVAAETKSKAYATETVQGTAQPQDGCEGPPHTFNKLELVDRNTFMMHAYSDSSFEVGDTITGKNRTRAHFYGATARDDAIAYVEGLSRQENDRVRKEQFEKEQEIKAGYAAEDAEQQRLYKALNTMDAGVWAKEFIGVLSRKPAGTMLDEGFMVGWFANAIMRGHDIGQTRLLEEQAKVQKDREAMHAEAWKAEKEEAVWDRVDHALRLFKLYGNIAGRTGAHDMMQCKPTHYQLEAAVGVCHANVERAAQIVCQHFGMLRLKRMLDPNPDLMHFVNMVAAFMFNFNAAAHHDTLRGLGNKECTPTWADPFKQLLGQLGMFDAHPDTATITKRVWDLIKGAVQQP